jgi:cytoplasmic iron level regulating protein YaaA (DUF328/UPF0246 family)
MEKPMKIALISCTKLKRDHECVAKDMYLPSNLFSKARKYVESKGYNKWFILSAKYGLLDVNEFIKPYNVTLNNMKATEIKEWSVSVFDKLIQYSPTQIDFYTGEKYRKYLIPLLEQEGVDYNIPLKGLGIGQQMQYYNQNRG